MAPIDAAALRMFVYDRLVGSALTPMSGEIGQHFGVSADDARAALRALKIGKTILVHPESGEIWMAGPFSAARSAYRLTDGERTWWANCGWDMLGIPIILGRRVTAYTSCTDCGAAMTFECDPTSQPAEDAVVHFLVPARRWYEDIGFT